MASEHSAETSLAPGQKVGGGRFVLVRLLGKGGMGVVWLARDERLQEDAALKFLPSEIRSDAIALDDMRRETQRSRKLTHPNIIRIHDFFEAEGEAPFISMEYVDGPNLNGLRAQQPNRIFGWVFLAPLVQQLCEALDYAHGEKVIHRDLKPANMMLDSKGRLKLADFGIAAVMSDSMSRISLQHAKSGTLTHMSPQQLDGKSPRVTDDIYALGATLYELLTSKPPFYTGDIAHQVRNLPVQPVEDRLAELDLTNEIPPQAAAMIMACLSKEPEQRPQSVRAVAEWIGLTQARPDARWASLAASNLPDALVPQSQTSATLTGIPKRLWWGAGITALFALACGGWFWANHPSANKSNDLRVLAIEGKREENVLPVNSLPEEGFVGLFNGRDLSGWEIPEEHHRKFWSVKDGALVCDSNTDFARIFWEGTVDDFELRFSYKLGHLISPGHGGCGPQYRLQFTATNAMGYGMSLGFGGNFLLSSEGRGTLALRGQKALAKNVNGRDALEVVGSVGNSDELFTVARDADWNDAVITVRGRHHVFQLNGRTTIEFTDENAAQRISSGKLALGLWNKERPFTGVQYKNIRLKRLADANAASAPTITAAAIAWIPLFDGKTLTDWTAPDPGDWRVATDGGIVSQGPRSHLFSPNTYANVEFKAEIKLSAGANGGMFFRAALGKGPVKGYEAQAANSDVQGTGSLYRFQSVAERLVGDNVWFNQHAVAIGNRVIIKVNDRIAVDYTDPNNTYRSGHLALQQQVPGKLLMYRNLMVKPLPANEALAWAEARKDMPDLPGGNR